MRIASEKTLQQFDKFKQQLYAHKRQKTIKPQKIKSPVSIKYRSLLPFFLIGGGLWVVYKYTPQLSKGYLVDKNYISYQQNLAWNAMEMYFKCKIKQVFGTNQSYSDKYLANRCYITKLESDLLYLTQKNPEKKLSIQTKSKFSFWILGLTNQQKIRYINQYGDLLEKNRSSKVMFGDFIRIWTNCSQRLLKRQKIFTFYEKQFDKIGKQCQKVNMLTKLQYKQDQYQEALKQCNIQSQIISQKIKKIILDRLAKQKKQKLIKN